MKPAAVSAGEEEIHFHPPCFNAAGIFHVKVKSCYCRSELSVTASGTRDSEPASVSASWLGSKQGVSQMNTTTISAPSNCSNTH